MLEGGCPVTSIVIESDFFAREFCEEVSEPRTRFHDSRPMETSLQLKNPFVLDLLGELKRCFVFYYREVIGWRIEIQLQEVVGTFAIPIGVEVERVATIFDSSLSKTNWLFAIEIC